ncbi:MAG: ACP S-malonyltransferase [Candidatus Omnitrophica bacterium]|nr:ACP S-malonyltransferase [Candidatus Omnitrophota bacterium]MCM8793263.1 ACP S-malonyltransferase [Candidatus Omnitrophota bacterium]
MDEKKIAFVFPGQGAQYVGMGKDVYESFRDVRLLFEKAEGVLKFDLKKLCFEGPAEKLKLTSLAQPAILVVSLSVLEALKILAPDISPQVVAGLSLGEYSALAFAGAIGFEDAVRLVYKRGEFMEEASRLHPGGMVSLLGLNYETVENICRESRAEIANLNCPGQIVISGTQEALEKAVNLAKEKGVKKAIYLEVSGPFHSSLMSSASKKLLVELNRIEIRTPRVPVVSNVTAYFENTPREIHTNLVNQINHPTRWEESVRFMVDGGVTLFLEIGPGKVLSGLIRRIDSSLEVYNIETVQDIKVFLEKIGMA